MQWISYSPKNKKKKAKEYSKYGSKMTSKSEYFYTIRSLLMAASKKPLCGVGI